MCSVWLRSVVAASWMLVFRDFLKATCRFFYVDANWRYQWVQGAFIRPCAAWGIKSFILGILFACHCNPRPRWSGVFFYDQF
ncbi:unnamed protein product [Rhodiola kirilowii]